MLQSLIYYGFLDRGLDMSKSIALFAVLLIIMGIGGLTVYQSILADSNSQATPATEPTATPTTQPTPTPVQEQAYEKITLVDANFSFRGRSISEGNIGYNWTVYLDLKNTGNVDSVIENIMLNGRPYSSYDPTIVDPPIEDGCVLSPNQQVTITMQGINTSTHPGLYYNTTIVAMTRAGNSYSFLRPK